MHDRVTSAPAYILRHTPPPRLKTIGLGAAAVAAIIIAAGLISRVQADQSLKSWTDDQAIPVVKVLNLKGSVADGALILPGNVQAFYDAPIHARVAGYLKKWYADIGTPVKAGQLLAEIDTPDLDQQLVQAKADLATAVANQHLSDTTAKRWAGLLAQDAVSHQDADQKNGDLAAKTALVAASQANVQRLQALESFKRITAPFDGVVTTRSTDIGALISVGGPTDIPLFTVADEKRLRVYVQVPQAYTGDIRPGMTAVLVLGDLDLVAGAQGVRRVVDHPIRRRQAGGDLHGRAEILADRDRLDHNAAIGAEHGDRHAGIAEHQRAGRGADRAAVDRQGEVDLGVLA